MSNMTAVLLLCNLLILKCCWLLAGCAPERDGPEDSDEECAGGQPIGQPAEGGWGHPGQAEERE